MCGLYHMSHLAELEINLSYTRYKHQALTEPGILSQRS
jgi:hypothetical protein